MFINNVLLWYANMKCKQRFLPFSFVLKKVLHMENLCRIHPQYLCSHYKGNWTIFTIIPVYTQSFKILPTIFKPLAQNWNVHHGRSAQAKLIFWEQYVRGCTLYGLYYIPTKDWKLLPSPRFAVLTSSTSWCVFHVLSWACPCMSVTIFLWTWQPAWLGHCCSTVTATGTKAILASERWPQITTMTR